MAVLNWIEKMFDKRFGAFKAALLFVIIPLLFTGCAPTISDEAREPIWAIEPQYLNAYDFSCGLACVGTESGIAYFVDKEGRQWQDRVFHTSWDIGFDNGISMIPGEDEERSFLYLNGITATSIKDCGDGGRMDMPLRDMHYFLSGIKGEGYLTNQGLWYQNWVFEETGPFIEGYSIASGYNGPLLVTEMGAIIEFYDYF